MTNTPTSGAADLPEAGCSKHHLIHCSQCRHDNMVRDLRAENDRLTTQLAALAAGQATAQQAVVPAGWRLVPVEPTQEMIDAMRSSVWLPACYRAMIAAAPTPPTSAEGVEHG